MTTGLDEFGEPFDIDEDVDIVHYGMPRRSGRYPWGSGENPYQHSKDFIARYDELHKSGMKEKEIAEALGCLNDKGAVSTNVLRARLAVSKAERFSYDYDTAVSMRADGKTNQEIADRLGYPSESSIRHLLAQDPNKKTKAFATAETISSLVDEKGFIDVGAGVEHELLISDTKLKQSLEILREEGYEVYSVGLQQVTNPGRQTPMRVVCPPGTSYKEAYDAMYSGDIHSVIDYTNNKNGDLVRDMPEPPVSMSSDRVYIRYAEDGGIDKDGLIEIRPGVKDLNLGDSAYAQVRIGVDNTHYMKGMCIYGRPEDFPKGADVIFNTNKSKDVPKLDVLKSMKDNPDNPFGALIKENGQSHYIGDDGKKHLSPINKIREEGDWDHWEKGLPHQFLAKQNIPLIKRQLNEAYAEHQAEYDDILALTNPIVKRHYLREFGDQCDSDAVYMKGASLPGQKWKVLIPTTKLKDNEVYDPTRQNGEEVALIRFPHQGTYEIPVCRVNNKKELRDRFGNLQDAVCINKHVADRLSGADFDGDTVIVVPMGNNPATRIKSTKLLKGLEGFDPKTAYATEKRATGKKDEDGNDIYEYIGRNGKPVKIMTDTNNQMGRISNLVTDMTIKGATDEELARATRHAQVVIDAEKHKLDYRASAKDNDIEGLKRKYQGRIEDDRYTESASTIFSRAKAKIDIPETKGNPRINPKTGEYEWEEKRTGRVYIDEKTGKEKLATKKAHQMDAVKDAHQLSSGYPKEELYADYANHLKAMANAARKEYMATERPRQDREAALIFAPQVASLKAKLNIAEQNAPRERQANLIAGSRARLKKEANPDMTKKEYKKLKAQELARARAEVSSRGKETRIVIDDKEWEAIQHGAISSTMLEKILDHSEPDTLRARATPRAATTLSDSKKAKIKNMSNAGYTLAEIADALGVSTSTVSSTLND